MSNNFEGYTAALLALVILFLLVFHSYKKYVAPYTVFPTSWVTIKIAWHSIMGSIPANTTRSSFAFQLFVQDLKKYLPEGYCVVWLPKPYVVVYNEEAVKILSNSQAAVNRAEIYHVLEIAFGKGIVTSKDEVWRKKRKLVQPAFNIPVLKIHTPTLNRNAAILVQRLMEVANEPAEIIRFLKICSLHNLLTSAFGMNCDKPIELAEEDELMERIDKLADFATARVANPLLQSKLMLSLLAYGRKMTEHITAEMSLIQKIIFREADLSLKRCNKKTFSEDDEDNSSCRKSFFEILLKTHLKDPSFTMEGVCEESINLLLAGYDTVSYALLWSLFLLGNHPDVQDQVYDEVEHLKGREITYEDVKNLAYTDCVIKEMLRLYPISPIYGRHLAQDVQCGEYHLPKGTNIGFSPYLLHRNPAVYPNPEKFDPERFKNNADRNPWSYTPFSEGIRNCLGKNYALIQIKITLAYILQNLKVTSLQRVEDIQVGWEIVLTPNQPVLLSFIPR